MATDNKYDRQLRLWGPEGQRLLSTSRVLSLGSSGLSSEILKNLVLPGIGFFTIIDEAKATEKDLGDNFFVTPNDLGKSRSEVVKNYLLELNPDVQGESLVKSVDEVLEDSGFLSQYNLIIASQVNFEQARTLGNLCEEKNVKLIIAKSNGLLGYLRIYCKEHLVIESKPADKEIFDLHLYAPFSGLSAYADGIQMEDSQDIYHAHVPYIVLLLKYVKEWEETHGHKPATFDEKELFKTFIKSKSRDFFQEMNYQEAVGKAYLCFITDPVPYEIQEILQHPNTLNATSTSEDFWICAKAVSEFITVHEVPPVTGAFPDMTSDTNSYIALQHIYQEKSEADYNEVLNTYKRIKNTTEEPTFVRDFCKNFFTLEVTRTRSIREELEEVNKQWIVEDDEEDISQVDWYLALRAFDQFFRVNSREPEKNDIAALKEITANIYRPVSNEIIEEIIRFGNSELHCISAVIGGVASQEAVKLITHQYTPINNTFIYNGVYSKAQVLNL